MSVAQDEKNISYHTNNVITIKDLITLLSKYQPENKPKSLGFIHDYVKLIDILSKIDKCIGLHELKDSLVGKFKSMVVNYHLYGKPLNEEKLHTILYGQPGTGKTLIGKLLAEFWWVSGCLKNSKKNTNQDINEYSLIHKMSDLNLKKIENNNNIQAIKIINEIRKKTIARNEKNQKYIDYKYQELKSLIKSNIKPEKQAFPIPIHKILPVQLPKTPNEQNIINNFTKVPFLNNNTSNSEEIKFVVLTRGDLIGKFQGHTTDKLKQLFDKYEGGVIMIDEVYDLCTSEKDDFGKEILSEIINHMTTHPDKIIFIFAGYRDNIEKGIFELQPGFKRRFTWNFEIKGYTSDEIADILFLQISNHNLHFDDNDKKYISDFISLNMNLFPYFGGDTEKLSVIIKDLYYNSMWNEAINDVLYNKEKFLLDRKLFDEACIIYKNKNLLNKTKNDKHYYESMYN